MIGHIKFDQNFRSYCDSQGVWKKIDLFLIKSYPPINPVDRFDYLSVVETLVAERGHIGVEAGDIEVGVEVGVEAGVEVGVGVGVEVGLEMGVVGSLVEQAWDCES